MDTITDEAVASFVDGADGIPVKSLIVDIDPAQAGTGDPSPSNIRPISGWSEVDLWRTGVNIWDEEWEVGSIDNTTGLPTANDTMIRSKNFIPVLPNTRYYMTDATGYRFAYDADKNFIGIFVLDNGPTPANCRFIKFRLPSTYGTTYNHDISINYPDTDHDYHAYDGDAYPITIPTPPGTVYGGTLNVTTGVLTVDRALKTFTGQESGWEKFSNNNPNGTYFGLPGTSSYAAFANDPDAICSINKRSSVASFDTGDGFYWTSSGWRILYGATGGTESLDNFKTYLQQKNTAGTPVSICAKLASPVEYQLTPVAVKTLLGSNAMWADTGNINTLTYYADPTLYTEKEIEKVETIITPNVSETMTAPTNLSEGDLVIAEHNLYKATAAIVSGASLIPNTNVVSTSVAAELSEIRGLL